MEKRLQPYGVGACNRMHRLDQAVALVYAAALSAWLLCTPFWFKVCIYTAVHCTYTEHCMHSGLVQGVRAIHTSHPVPWRLPSQRTLSQAAPLLHQVLESVHPARVIASCRLVLAVLMPVAFTAVRQPGAPPQPATICDRDCNCTHPACNHTHLACTHMHPACGHACH